MRGFAGDVGVLRCQIGGRGAATGVEERFAWETR